MNGIVKALRAAIELALGWLRVLLLCSYPILGTATAFYFTAFSDQGVDLLLDALPHAAGPTVPGAPPGGYSAAALAHLVLSAGSVIVAALSIWWPARLLVRREFAFFPIPQAPTAPLRKWLPRVLATAVVLGVGVGYARIAFRFGSLDAGLAAGGWLLAAGALCVALSKRRDWYRVATRGTHAAVDATATEPNLPTSQTILVVACVIAYVVLALAFAALPVALPRAFGGTALIFAGVGGITFIVTMTIAYLPLAKGHPTLTVIAATATLLFSTWLDNHQMRRSEFASEDGRVVAGTPQAHADAWAAARRGAPCARDGTPVLHVAAAGGGIRAGYWTARVLEELSAQLGADFDCSLFALSGVSGGSLGVAGYLAFNLGKVEAARAAGPAASAAPGGADHRASSALGNDYLSPAVAGLLFYDTVQRVFPVPIGLLDRSRGLESAFESAFDAADGKPFRHTLRALGRGNAMTPMVFLNTTVVEDGRRAIESNVDVRAFVDTYDLACPNLPEAAAPSTAAISLAGAVHNSARFTYVSPAGRIARLGDCSPGSGIDARLVDGGYFENSGAATLVQLVCLLSSCEQTPSSGAAPLPIAGLPVLLLVRNSPGTRPYCDETRRGARCLSLSQGDPGAGPTPSLSRFLPEVTSPLRALLTVREQRERLAVIAAAEEFRRRGGVVIEAYLPVERDLPEPPLGWSLSSGVRAALDYSARRIVSGCQRTLLALFSGRELLPGCESPEAARGVAKAATDIATKRATPASGASSR